MAQTSGSQWDINLRLYGFKCGAGTMHVRTFAAVAGMLLFSGCAIHPLPDDVAHISTYYIVRQIRCETRQAVIDSLFRYLTSPDNLHEGKLDEYSYNVGLQVKREYDVDRDSITRFRSE